MTEQELVIQIIKKYGQQWKAMIRLFWGCGIYPKSWPEDWIKYLKVQAILRGEEWFEAAEKSILPR